MKSYVSILSFLVASFAILSTKASIDPRSERWTKEREEFPKNLRMSSDDDYWFDLTISPEPVPSEGLFDDEIEFLLYGNGNENGPVELKFNNRGELQAWRFLTYDKKLPTVFITHGWISDADSESCTLIRDAFMRHGGFNVIVVDWSFISFNNYEDAALQVGDVGMKVGKMIKKLSVGNYLQISETILVGHSLGAHVMGIAGSYLNGNVKSIFGLDPALPLFKFARVGERLTKHDAKYVEVIHTNAGKLGIDELLADVDFLVNDGTNQPGCSLLEDYDCSHNRAYHVYAESINSARYFVGPKCTRASKRFIICVSKETAIMGGVKAYKNINGVFYIPTNACPPFAIGYNVTGLHSCKTRGSTNH